MVKSKMKHLMVTLWQDEAGATAIEYGLIASLIAVGIIAAARALGDKVSGTFGRIQSEMR